MSKLPSQAWHNLAIDIQKANNQRLQNFIELSDTERCVVLQRVARNLRTATTEEPTPYDDLNQRISDLLKNGVDDDLSQSFFTDNSSPIKTEIVLNKICDDIVSLLHKRSDQKSKFHAFFNQILPQPIRFVSWYLYLSNANHRQKFLNDLANHPQSVLSPMDTEIQHNCDRLIAIVPLAFDMKNFKENMNAMKVILSYYRALFADKRDLVDAEYYYAIPIVLSYSTSLSRSEESNAISLSILIEMYRTFLDKMPLILRNNYLNNSIQNFDPWFRKIEYYLQNIDQIVYNHILRASNSHISTTEDSHALILLRKCCYPWFKHMFVGSLATDPLLFVWEQYLITSDISNFHDEFLPAIAAGIIMILKDLLLEYDKASDIESVLQNKTNVIETHQLQSMIARFFLPNLKTKIVKLDHIEIDRQSVNRSEQPRHIKLNPVHDLLRTLAKTCNRVIHGEGKDNVILNEQTKNSIHVLKFDLKMAEREVIGRILSIDERNALSYQQKQIYNQQKLQAVNVRIQNRYVVERKRLLDKN